MQPKPTRIVLAAVLAFLLICNINCAQNTESKQAQAPDQRTITPTETAQKQGTQGTVIVNNFNFGVLPGGDVPALPAGVVLPKEMGALPYTITSPGPGGSNGVNTGWGMAGNTINFTMTTGGTTPSLTGTTSGTATATQTPTQTHTGTATQTVTPEFTTAVPVSVGMPGSAVSGTANAAGSGGTLSNPQSTATQTPTYTALTATATADKLAGVIQAMQAWLEAIKSPTTVPAP